MTIDSKVDRLRTVLEQVRENSATIALLNDYLFWRLDWIKRIILDLTHGLLVHSYLFRTLTKEPEGEIIILSLRDMSTVAPVFASADWAIKEIRPFWENSLTRRAVSALEQLLRDMLKIE